MDDNIGAWLGTPPERPEEAQDVSMNDVGNDSDVSAPAISPQPSSKADSDMQEITNGVEQSAIEPENDDAEADVEADTESADGPQQDEEVEVVAERSVSPARQEGLEIVIPELDDDERDEYQYLPDHFTVKKVYHTYPGAKCLVKLASGEVEMLDRSTMVQEYHDGKLALNKYQSDRNKKTIDARKIPEMNEEGYINWNKFKVSDSESQAAETYRFSRRRRSRRNYAGQDLTQDGPASSNEGMDAFLDDSDDARPSGRRSGRLQQSARTYYYHQKELRSELRDLGSDSDVVEIKRRGRPSKKAQPPRRGPTSRAQRAQYKESSEERYSPDGARRSERTRRLPMRSMLEKQEDDLSSQSEKDLGPKVVATKEFFPKVSVNDAFRRRHQQECSTCYYAGDNDQKGPLVFCQGCTNSYHKTCLGPRGSREHLVTKVGDQLFVLQCRKCIGVLKEKDANAPHYGKCTGCDKINGLSRPLRRRIGTRQEQIQREENGGIDPITITQKVRNSSQGIDLARVKEVDSAFVKYKGLGFEDAIWEKPPGYADTDRFLDFKEAYEDFVKKRYMSIPPQSTLRRRLADIRALDFETKLIKKEQPPIMTGGKIMGYQLEGHNWLYYQWYRQHNAILADEMGLGKTIQLIALMATLIHEHKCWPFLIVVPNSTCPNWRREIKKWIPSLRAVCYYGSSAARKLTHDYELFPKDPDDEPGQKRDKREVKEIKAHIVIASYESIVEKTTANSLKRVPWQGLIMDEGQRLKNDKNLVYDALAQLNFKYKVLMT
ncbi:hypothetical protein LTR66_015943, partial [Elasticomyces elasticus]